ncbi:peptidylprolyl isomerase [Lachnospiraceae bacterium 29-84]
MKKKITAVLLCAVLCAVLAVGCGSANNNGSGSGGSTGSTEDGAGTESTQQAGQENVQEPEEEAENAQEPDEPSAEDGSLLSGLHHVEIEIDGYGTLSVELDADTAPITVTNFVNLAKDGFYDGLTFHRIISGFMIQGGDPLGDGMGGADTEIKGEFSSNGVENSISHKRGVISMARSNKPDSASSQFFIVHQDSAFLDGEYAAFGHVTEGMEVVDKICEDTPVQDSDGMVDAGDQPVITKIKVID